MHNRGEEKLTSDLETDSHVVHPENGTMGTWRRWWPCVNGPIQPPVA